MPKVFADTVEGIRRMNMKQITKIALLALGFGLLSMSFFSMHGRTVRAQSIKNGTTANTQVALYCANPLLVTSNGPTTCAAWYTTNPDGSASNFPGVPAGQTFIVTDIECTLYGKAGEYGTCDLYSLDDYNYTVNPTTIVAAGALAGPHGVSVMAAHLTTGVAFTGLSIPEIITTDNPKFMTMQGYLIPTPAAAAGD
jgi:hypothetical protein